MTATTLAVLAVVACQLPAVRWQVRLVVALALAAAAVALLIAGAVG